MILVLIFFSIIILLILIAFLILISDLKIYIKNIYLSNIKKENNENAKNSDIKISLSIFNKLNFISLKLNKDRIKNIGKKFHIEKLDIKKIEKEVQPKDLLLLKELKIKISKLNLDVKLGVEDVILTSYIIALISILISNILPHIIKKNMYKNFFYDIKPIYKDKNLYEISLNCIIEVKMVHIINMIYKIVKKRRSDKNERTSNRRAYDNSDEQFAKYG